MWVTPLRKGMSAFWDGLKSANNAAIETMGEPVTIGGAAVAAIVDAVSFNESAAAGGRKTILAARLLVAPEVTLVDGMHVVFREAEGRVMSWELLAPGGHRVVQVGPVNRWSGEIPGA